ncbi:MAG: ribose 5-phosphate isomerase B [Eubacteriaceae bacterium]|jgi:ribose 5-phosphate isomerase B|nr:ribose 5-phosphate isomerase B [Eubacteriaceae bacterium]
MEAKKMCIASDHAGWELKELIIGYLESMEIYPDDLGCYSKESVDYPEYGKKCGEAVASGKYAAGIVICGTGIGISMAANKVKGVRCALCTSTEMAEYAARHNNANILALGARTTPPEVALQILTTWMNTDFEGGRHKRRTDMLDAM